MSVKEKMTAIADAIRNEIGETKLLTLDDMAADIPKVYDRGRETEYDEFWDSVQQNGSRTNYSYAFAGDMASTFKPKYSMQPKSVYYMFAYFNHYATPALSVDLVELLEEAGVTIDFSNCTSFGNWLMWSNITRIGVIDCKAFTGPFHCYYAHQLRTIDKLILYEGNGTSFNWEGCSWLTNITIEGVIEKAFDIHYTKRLTHESLMSIINALKNLSGSGKTLTLTIGSDNLAKLTDSEKAIATQKGWTLA